MIDVRLRGERQYLVVNGWLLWLLAVVVERKLARITSLLVLDHPLLHVGIFHAHAAAPLDANVEASRSILSEFTPPAYEGQPLRRNCNRQDALFWHGAHGHGPHFLVFLTRAKMLTCAIALSVSYSWLAASPEDASLVACAVLPLLLTALESPHRVLRDLTIASSVELMKKPQLIHETMVEMKVEEAMRRMRVLLSLETAANVANIKKSILGTIEHTRRMAMGCLHRAGARVKSGGVVLGRSDEPDTARASRVTDAASGKSDAFMH